MGGLERPVVFPFLEPTAPTSPAALAAFAQDVASNVVNVATALAVAGVTDVLVINLPDLGTTPYADYNTPGTPGLGDLLFALFGGDPSALSDYLTIASQLYNTALEDQLAASGIDVSFFLVDASLRDVLDNPASYGITNVDDPCLQSVVPTIETCSNADEYVFWDDVHPTTVIHQVLAGQLLPVIRGVPEPSPVLLIILGLCVVLGFSRRPVRAGQTVLGPTGR